MLGFLKKIFGDKATKDIKALQPYVEKTNEIFVTLNSLSNDELRGRTALLQDQIQLFIKEDVDKIEALKADAAIEKDVEKKEAIFDQIDEINKNIESQLEIVLLDILPEAFAIMKETARRFTENETVEVTASSFDKDLAAEREFITINGDKAIWNTTWNNGSDDVKWNMVHYDVQLIGGAALHQGKIAEMQTGEGKTLVATLPVFLNALTGRGVHLVTVNDYLAKRDSRWMGPIYQFHGLSVDCIDLHQPNSEARKKAYRSDITFGTNNEFGFDYLRDNMSGDVEGIVQRRHHFAIVDEVDSVLIDDARTPLIISGPTPGGDKHQFDELKPVVEKLVSFQKREVTTFLAEAKKLLANIESASKQDLEAGGIALLRAFRGLPKSKALIKFLSEPGIKTHLQKTENHYLQDHGREMPKIDKELFFTIDEKNNQVELTEKGIDLVSGKENPDFFVLPDIATSLSELENADVDGQERVRLKEEILQDYHVKSERIHSMNQLFKAYALFEKDTEYVVMNNKVMIVDEQTGRIMDGRRYSDGLHQAIESKENVKVEAATQTYATVTLQNYFRMYHKLCGMTGTAETEAGEFWDIYKLDVVVIPTNRPILRDDREDKIYKTVREKYQAVIEEIENVRSEGRAILVGTTSVEISELLSKALKLKGIPHNVLNAKQHEREADIVAMAGQPKMVTIATNMAGRGTDIKLSPEVKEAGGLAIIGTERHDSRRVDRQLRGRAGRQGDPGMSQFYVSLEDHLMRLFGSERIAKYMDKLGLEEGEVIQSPIITKSIERAQKKVEENNFGVRKRLLEYDDVMNAQREVIYKKRRNALYGERLQVDVSEMFYNVCESLVNEAKAEADIEVLKYHLLETLATECPITEEEFKRENAEQLTEKLFHTLYNKYQERKERVAAQVLPVIKNVHENNAKKFLNIAIPFTDGVKGMQVSVNIEKAISSNGLDVFAAVERQISLGVIDNEWKEHLRQMDDLRQSVQMAVHEQKDPLLIYKFESFELFKQMMVKVSKEIVSFLNVAGIPAPNPEEVQAQIKEAKAPTKPKVDVTKLKATHNDYDEQNKPGYHDPSAQQKQQPVVAEPKIGRNDPCPCGSGKKYKQCHGQ